MTGRYGHAEIEVPGTPEQVWQAIATEQGLAAWGFAADIEPAEGGAMMIHREPFGRDVETVVTNYDPAHSFGFSEPIPGAPSPLATEILVEARSGGSCVVRVICGLADAGEEWEDLVDAALEGWRMSLQVLAAYLRSFPGWSAIAIDVSAVINTAPVDRAAPADALFSRLGLPSEMRAAGEGFRTAPGAPELSGIVDYADAGYLLLRGEAPFPCLMAFSCFPMGPDKPMSINLMGRIYSPPHERVAQIRMQWQAWLADHTSQ